MSKNKQDPELVRILNLNIPLPFNAEVFNSEVDDSIFTTLLFEPLAPWFSRDMVYAISYFLPDAEDGLFFETLDDEQGMKYLAELGELYNFVPPEVTISNFGNPSRTKENFYKGPFLFDKSGYTVIAVDPTTYEVFIKIPGNLSFRSVGYIDRIPGDNHHNNLEASFRICYLSTILHKSWIDSGMPE